MDISQKEIEHGLKSIAKSSIIVFFAVLSSKLLLYFYRIIIARYFGPEGYGLFSLSLIVFYFFLALSTLGLADGLLRYISLFRGQKKTEEINFLFKNILMISIVSSIFFGIILFFTSNIIATNIFHEPGLAVLLRIFSFAIPLSVVSTIYMNTLRAYEKISLYSLNMNIIQNISRLIIMIFLIFIGIKSYSVTALSYLIGTSFLLLSSYIFCRTNLPQVFFPPEIEKEKKKEIIVEVFRYSWPIMFLSIIMSIFYWIDSFVLGYFKGAIDVGFYNAAVPIIALFAVTPEIFMQLFFPMIMRQFSKKNIMIKELSKQIGKWIFLFNFPFFILLLLFPGAVINILFGKEYIIAENALRILALSGLIGSFIPLLTNLLAMIGKSKTILLVILFTSLINLILNILLIPAYGLVGAAISTTISTLLLSGILLIKVRSDTGIFPFRRKQIRIIIISIIPIIILLIYRKLVVINTITLIIGLITFCLIYSLLILLLEGLDSNDYLILYSLKEKLLKSYKSF